MLKVVIKLFLGFQDVQHTNIDAKVLRIYPPQVGNVSVEATSNENGDSDNSIQRNKSNAKWKSVGSGNLQNQPTHYSRIVPLLGFP